MVDPACPETQVPRYGGVLGLSAEKLGHVCSTRGGEVSDESIAFHLRRGHVVTDRKIDNDVDRHRLRDVLPSNERRRHERVGSELELVTLATTVLVIDLQTAIASRGSVPSTVIDGTGAVQRLSDTVHRENLRICEQDDSFLRCSPALMSLGGY